MIYLVTRIDTVVHGQLYNFGLIFDHAWADPYYSYTQMMYVGLGVPMVLSVLAILGSFPRPVKAPEVKVAPQTAAKQAPKPQPQPQAVACEDRKAKENEKETRNGTTGMVISCPSCKKVFSRPLVMLNFEGGKTRLVNVCPYCNHVLGNAEHEKSTESDTQIADMDKKLAH
jgi:uncharacterized Zn-finger protein